MVIAEYYTNTLSRASHPFIRYWVTPNILVGGNVCDKADFEHLQKEFNIQAVINVDGGNSDKGKGIKNLLEFNVQDNGDPFPEEYLKQTVEFASFKLSERQNIYVHCHVGASRSPHFVYLLLRTYYKMPKEIAIRYIFNSLPPQHQPGYNQWTHVYTKSIEDALKNIYEKR